MAAAKNERNDDEFEPGAAQFGNFINYYEFNPPSNRLALFQGKFCDFFPTNQPLLCLDVGCNTGVSFSHCRLSNCIDSLFGFLFLKSIVSIIVE